MYLNLKKPSFTILKKVKIYQKLTCNCEGCIFASRHPVNIFCLTKVGSTVILFPIKMQFVIGVNNKIMQ